MSTKLNILFGRFLFIEYNFIKKIFLGRKKDVSRAISTIEGIPKGRYRKS